jgi:hypothetical protein
VYETINYFICLILVVEVLHMALLTLFSVFAASRLPNPVLRINIFSIAM